jgi:quercetin dioxygenase-like cupin family protein
MHRRTVFSALIAMLFLTIGTSIAFGQTPPGPVVRHLFRTAGLPQPAPFNVVQSILNFDPGAATPFHTHPGQLIVTVLAGELTFKLNGNDTVYTVGQTFVELPNQVVQARNAGTVRTSVMVSYFIPKDAPLSHPEPGDATPQPRPFVSYQFKTDVGTMTDPFDVVQQLLDFAPGASTPVHMHPGIVVVTVLAGELTFQLNGADTVYKEGESFVEVPGQVVQARNVGAAQTSVMVSYIIPKDAPLSIIHQAAVAPSALPATGGATEDALPVWLLGLAAGGLMAGGWFVRRRQGRG